VVQTASVSVALDTRLTRHPWLAVAIIAAGLAAWMGLGTLHDFQHADSLLTVLISTQRWTPFFWGQDRFGMLVPLAALPIHHPMYNLLFQGWVMTVAALVAPFAAARFLTGRTGDWIAIGACTNVLFLLITTPAVQFDWLVTQPYGLSICLGFSGLVVAADDDRVFHLIAASILLVLACWVNVGIVALLAIGTVVKGSRAFRLLTLQAMAAAAMALAARYLASAHTTTALASPAQWPSGWRQLLEGSSGVVGSPAAAIVIAAATAMSLAWLWETGAMPARQAGAAIVAMAIGTWIVIGTSLWVGMNRYSFRYMYPTLMIAGVGASMLFAALCAKRARWFSRAVMAALIAIATIRYGAPSPGRVARGLDDRFGRQTAAVLHNGATVIAGDYWRVWPAVFHANLSLARTHTHARVFGLAYRSEATDPLWKNNGRPVLLAGWPDDPSVAAVAGEHGVAVTLRTHLPELDLYTGQP
jgi:hypothetical protein